MLKRLTITKTPALPALTRVVKSERRLVARMIYLGLVALLAVGLANHFFGALVLFRADGLVMRERVAVAGSYAARVVSIHVRPGQSVAAGEILLQLESTDILERLADLSARRAEQTVRLAEVRARAAVVDALLPLAAAHASEATRVTTALDGLMNAKLVTSARYEEALRDLYSARETHVRLASEHTAMTSQVDDVAQAAATAAAAFVDLERHYAHGVVRAPATGVVGTRTPSVGEVVKPGDAILSIFSGTNYVLAYLPQQYLFSVRIGQRVKVHGGRRDASGVITEILPVTDALPVEFQSAFKPRDRSRLAKIRLSEATPFAVYEKVKVSGF